MTSSPALIALGDSSFVQLTTFRRNGEPVPTAVWIVRDGDAISAFTPTSAGKLKRLKHTTRVTVVACTRSGAVQAGDQPVEAEAVVSTDPGDVARVTKRLAEKYGFQLKVAMLIEKLTSRGKGRERAAITITD